MEVESPAGNFVLSFDNMEVGDEEIIITGKMGLWEAKTHMSPAEFLLLMRLTMRPSILLFLVRVLFRSVFRRNKSKADS